MVVLDLLSLLSRLLHLSFVFPADAGGLRQPRRRSDLKVFGLVLGVWVLACSDPSDSWMLSVYLVTLMLLLGLVGMLIQEFACNGSGSVAVKLVLSLSLRRHYRLSSLDLEPRLFTLQVVGSSFGQISVVSPRLPWLVPSGYARGSFESLEQYNELCVWASSI
ncbi:hypothetical protein YC2023_007821 [Brassica napus]